MIISKVASFDAFPLTSDPLLEIIILLFIQLAEATGPNVLPVAAD